MPGLKSSYLTKSKIWLSLPKYVLGYPQLRHVPKSIRQSSFSISDILLITFLGIGTLRSYPKPYRQLTVNRLSPLELGKKYCITYLGLYLSKKSINFQKIWALWKALEAIFQMQYSPIFYLHSWKRYKGQCQLIVFHERLKKIASPIKSHISAKT